MHAKQLARRAALLVALGVGAASGSAAAAPGAATPAAAAQALYDQAAAAMEAHDFAAACPKLEEVVRLIPDGLGAKLTLAACYEGAGRLASAWSMYSLAEAGARNGKQPQRAAAARKHAEALKPKLAQLTVQVPEALRRVPGLAVERDGVPVGEVQWGVPLPVDRGEHLVTASAPGRPRWEKKLVVASDGAGETVEIALGSAGESASGRAANPAGPRAEGAAAAPVPGGRWGAQRIAGVAVTGLGVVGLGVGAVFGLRAAGLKSDSDDGHCRPDDACDAEGVALRNDARSAGTLSTALFIAGGVAAAGGAALFLTAPNAAGAPNAAIVVGPGGLALRGRW